MDHAERVEGAEAVLWLIRRVDWGKFKCEFLQVAARAE